MSYSIITQSWVSYHSYLPRTYLATPNFLYSAFDVINYLTSLPGLYRHHNIGTFTRFYGKNYPFIVELVSISNPIVERNWIDISLRVTAKRYDFNAEQYVDIEDVFFDKLIAYNKNQSTGLQHIVNKDAILKSIPENYMLQSISSANGEIYTSNVNGVWNINNLRN